MDDFKSKQIVFFDGVCNLCNSLVNFLLERDKKQRLFFASLQGENAKKLIPDYTKELNTLVFWIDGEIYTKSNAVIKIGENLEGFWKIIFTVIKIIPNLIRDFFYNLISKNRYKFFGKKDTCRIPSEKEKERFLD